MFSKKVASKTNTCKVADLEFDGIWRRNEDFFASRIMYAPVKMIFMKELRRLVTPVSSRPFELKKEAA